MRDEKEEWIDETLGSLEGIKRAKPPVDLFDKIEIQIKQGKTKTIYFTQWRPAIAAAVLLLVLNVFAARLYTQKSSSVETEMGLEIAYETQLISDFKLYDE